MRMGKKRLIIMTVVALVCCLTVWATENLLDRIPTFLVSKITIIGAKRCNREKILNLAFSSAYGRCIFKVKLADLYRQIRSDGWIKDICIRRSLPSTLEIQVKERVPVGIIKADQLYLVDKEGVLIAAISDKKAWLRLPIISGLDLERVEVGSKPDSSKLEAALQALCLMQAMKAPWLADFSEISVKNPENITLSSQSKGCQIHLGISNLQQSLQYLKAAWNSLQTRVSSIKYIDLRYKNQLIIKPQTKHMG